MKRGQLLGLVGNSGTSDGARGTKNGAHLHFEIIIQDENGERFLGQGLDHAELLDLVASDSAYVLIDPRDPVEHVCAAIASCAHVFASSLHGLITADAYGVANTWVAPEGLGRLKFHDYAASVGRDMRVPIALADIPAARKPDAPLFYHDGIAACRAALIEHFPAALYAHEGAA